jgi:hypothetical protein
MPLHAHTHVYVYVISYVVEAAWSFRLVVGLHVYLDLVEL